MRSCGGAEATTRINREVRRQKLLEKNARVQKKLAELELSIQKTEQEEDEDEHELIYDPDDRGELHGEALAQAERAAARPGVSGRMEEAIESIIAKDRVQTQTNSNEKGDADYHFEGEPAAYGCV